MGNLCCTIVSLVWGPAVLRENSAEGASCSIWTSPSLLGFHQIFDGRVQSGGSENSHIPAEIHPQASSQPVAVHSWHFSLLFENQPHMHSSCFPHSLIRGEDPLGVLLAGTSESVCSPLGVGRERKAAVSQSCSRPQKQVSVCKPRILSFAHLVGVISLWLLLESVLLPPCHVNRHISHHPCVTQLFHLHGQTLKSKQHWSTVVKWNLKRVKR